MKVYNLKTTTDELNPDLFNFLEEVLPYRYDEEIFKWEYGHPDKVFGYIEDLNGKVIGALGMIPIYLTTKTNLVLTAKAETGYLAASAQGQGLFRKLNTKVVDKARENGIELIWGFTALGPAFKKIGYTTKNEFLYYSTLQIRPSSISIKLIKPSNFVKYVRSFIDSHKANRFHNKTKSHIKETFKGVYVEERLKEPDDIRFFCKRLKDENRDIISIEMNRDYLSYRIDKNPFIKYKTSFVYDKEKKLLGYYFLSIKEDQGRAYISDVTALDRNVKEVLISLAITEVIKNRRIKSIKMFGNLLNPLIAETFDILDQYGANKKDSELYLVLLVLNDKGTQIFEKLENWYINGLWTQGITQ